MDPRQIDVANKRKQEDDQIRKINADAARERGELFYWRKINDLTPDDIKNELHLDVTPGAAADIRDLKNAPILLGDGLYEGPPIKIPEKWPFADRTISQQIRVRDGYVYPSPLPTTPETMAQAFTGVAKFIKGQGFNAIEFHLPEPKKKTGRYMYDVLDRLDAQIAAAEKENMAITFHHSIDEFFDHYVTVLGNDSLPDRFTHKLADVLGASRIKDRLEAEQKIKGDRALVREWYEAKKAILMVNAEGQSRGREYMERLGEFDRNKGQSLDDKFSQVSAPPATPADQMDKLTADLRNKAYVDEVMTGKNDVAGFATAAKTELQKLNQELEAINTLRQSVEKSVGRFDAALIKMQDFPNLAKFEQTSKNCEDSQNERAKLLASLDKAQTELERKVDALSKGLDAIRAEKTAAIDRDPALDAAQKTAQKGKIEKDFKDAKTSAGLDEVKIALTSSKTALTKVTTESANLPGKITNTKQELNEMRRQEGRRNIP